MRHGGTKSRHSIGSPVLLHMAQTAFGWLPTPTGATFTINATTDVATMTAHGFPIGEVIGPFQLTTAGGLPAGLALLTDYWIVAIDANTFKFYASVVNAKTATPIDVTTAGTGAHTATPKTSGNVSSWKQSSGEAVGEFEIEIVADGDVTLSAMEIAGLDGIYYSYGLLNVGSDIVLKATKGYRERFAHSARTTDYRITGTHPGTVKVWVYVRPVTQLY